MEKMNIHVPITPATDQTDFRLFPLAMAYIPIQPWETPYEPDVSLTRGTIFPSLDLPFIGEEAASRARRK